MRWPVFYIAFCAVVLGGFAYGKYYGLDLGDTPPSRPGSSSTSSSGSSFHYVGTSGGYHK